MSASEDDLRVCLAGYGLSGRVFHAPFLSAVPGLRLEAVVSSRGAEIAQAWPQASVYPTLGAALGDRDIDLVVVATPNETHVSLAKESLNAGKHVAIDKPVAATSSEVRELEQLAAETGRVLAPFHNRRWDGDWLTLRQILREERLGRLVTLSSRFDRFRPLVREGSWKEAGGVGHGLLMDLGPHLVDQALSLLGAPAAVTASVRSERDGTSIEDAFDLWLHYPQTLVKLGSSLMAADPQPRFLAEGTQGSFRKTGVDPQEPALVGGATVPPVGSETRWLPEAPEAWGELILVPDAARPDERQRTRVETVPGDYRRFYLNLRDAIRDGAPLEVTARDAWRALRLLELARESSRTGRSVAVSLD